MQLNCYCIFSQTCCMKNCACRVVNGKILASPRKQLICEIPLLKQVYNQLDLVGKAGLTIVELARQLGLQQNDGKILLRNLCRKGLAVCTLHDQGKSGIQRYTFSFISVDVVIISGSFMSSPQLLCLCPSYLCLFTKCQ